MSRQLNLRVSDEFAAKLERLSRRCGRPMASVLESVGTPAIEAAEARGHEWLVERVAEVLGKAAA